MSICPWQASASSAKACTSSQELCIIKHKKSRCDQDKFCATVFAQLLDVFGTVDDVNHLERGWFMQGLTKSCCLVMEHVDKVDVHLNVLNACWG